MKLDTNSWTQPCTSKPTSVRSHLSVLFDPGKPSSVNILGSGASEGEFVEEYRIVSAAVSQPFLDMDEKYSGTYVHSHRDLSLLAN